ncbi:MAG: ankyrin repeat domain-containing protein [Polyangiales bacterium]
MPARKPRAPATLLDAVKARDLEATRALLDAGADPDAPGPYDERPLGAAVYARILHPEVDAIASLLMARGADPQKVGAFDATPLELAAQHGAEVIAQEMMRVVGPRFAPRAAQGTRLSLLQCACQGGLRWLVARCVALGQSDREITADGRSCLHLATSVNPQSESPPAERLALVDELLARGADPNLRRPGEWGGTPLHSAAASADAAVVTRLLDAGASLDARSDVSGHQPIHRAAYGERVDVVAALCARGADVTSTAAGGAQPLHLLGARTRYLATSAMVDAFVDHGADINALDDRGVSPLAAAIGQHGNTRAPLDAREVATLARFVARGADLRCAAPGGATLLILAGRLGDAALAQIALGGSEIGQVDGHGWSALHYAATQADGAVAGALLAAGADPTQPTRKRHTAARTAFPAGSTAKDIARALGAAAVLERLA